MNKKTKIAIIVAAAVLLPCGALALPLLFGLRKRNGSADNAAAESLSTGSFPLSYNPGVKLELVKELQRKLNSRMATAGILPTCDGVEIKSLAVDGYFGAKTLSAVRLYLGTDTVTAAQFNDL